MIRNELCLEDDSNASNCKRMSVKEFNPLEKKKNNNFRISLDKNKEILPGKRNSTMKCLLIHECDFTLCCPVLSVPCPPQSLAFMGSSEENCSLTWDTVAHADSYKAFIKRGDGVEDSCNTNSNNCTFHCECGYTYLLSVCAFNQAGSSPPGEILNHTTGEYHLR